jgi:hypothetical protein
MTKEEALEVLLTRKPMCKCTGCSGVKYFVVSATTVKKCEICLGDGEEMDSTYALACTILGELTQTKPTTEPEFVLIDLNGHGMYYTTFRVVG